MTERKRAKGWGLVVGACAVALVGAGAIPASASTSDQGAAVTEISGVLDPSTFEGPVLVATPDGEVLVEVAAGELEEVAEEIRGDVAAGIITPSRNLAQGEAGALAEASPNTDVGILGTCSTWQNAVASPFGYALSGTGCAVFGYEGYERQYAWRNNSDVTACLQALGFNSSGAQSWYSLGCTPTSGVNVSWGNVLAYTQVRGLSVSGATGAGYSWWD